MYWSISYMTHKYPGASTLGRGNMFLREEQKPAMWILNGYLSKDIESGRETAAA
jgi:hypothetical protein